MKTQNIKTKDLTLISLCTAILCILSPISIPIPISPAPITLSFFAIVLIGVILEKWQGVFCVFLYIMIGFLGVPVFSNFTGGFQKILGPTGGYIIGYLFMVAIVGYFNETFHHNIYMNMIGALLGMIACYGFGTLWLSIQLNIGVKESIIMGVIPFVILDIIKVIFAVIISFEVKKRLSFFI